MLERFATRACIAVCGAMVCLNAARAATHTSGQQFSQIERGRYLTVIADCAACHTRSEDAPFAGGVPIKTPFGTVVSSNITPDGDTGIGAWSDAEFDAAVRQGKRPDGRRLYPAMPYPYFTRMSSQDMLAIRAYLNTLQPVHAAVRSNQLPFPYNVRALMNAWNWLYFDPGPFRSDPARSELWNRGAYIVEGPGHCGACHTPKTLLGGDNGNEKLQGYAIQGWFAPALTNNRQHGLAAWSTTDLVEYLKNGHNRFAAASGPMADEVEHSSSVATDADLLAIATYLKEGRETDSPSTAVAAGNPQMQAGAAIYSDLCAGCHNSQGTGVPYLIPNLAGSASVAAPEPTTLLQVVLRGAPSVATAKEPTAAAMPSFGWQLNDVQVAAVVTYVRNSWGHAAGAVSASEAGKARAQLGSAP